MRNLLKTTVLILGLMLVMATTGWCRGAADVSMGMHNLSVTSDVSQIYWSDSEELCVFCHTPHGGSLDGPLWNKDMSSYSAGTPFTHYTNDLLSTTLQGKDVNRPVSPESLLCLSCHDGSLSVFSVHNVANSHSAAVYSQDFDDDMRIIATTKPNARIGAAPGDLGGTRNLSDDHPISFSYSEVLLDDYYIAGGSRDGELWPVATAETNNSEADGVGVRFFGADKRVECSTCHDPHVDYISNTAYAPFLIMPNTNSDLCFACHNK